MVGPPPTINLFSLATHCIHAAILASTPIQALRRRCRTKDDGTLVTDADGAAQYIIYSELRSVHSGVRIVGEESDMEMKAEENRCLQNSRSTSHPYTDTLGEDPKTHDKNDCSTTSELLSTSSHEMLLEQLQDIMKEHLLFADTPTEKTSSTTIEPQKSQSESIDYRRVSIFVDPLDGTSSYAKGEYEVVTILIAIIVDNLPVFGVIVKPFQAGIQLETFRDTGCSVIYGGSLIGGAFTIGKDGGVVELERSHQFRLYRNQHPHLNFHSSTISHPHKRQQEDEHLNNDNHNYENTIQKKNSSSKRCKKESLSSSTMDLSQLDQSKYNNTNNYNDKDDDHYENITENNHGHTSRVESDNITTTLNAQVEPLASSITLPSPSSTHLPFNVKTPPPTPTSTSIITSQNTTTATSSSSSRHEHLLRAIISKSRSGGIVQKCIHELSSQNLLHPEPLYITGAGYKTMKLVIGQDNEGLWFFPKPGTSLWDVAAADALLRVMGGRISDRYGKDLDYQKGRMDAENIHGIIACIDEHLHTKCVELCLAEKWDHVQEQS